jgi:DNA-binding MarR family transcriptional regulator
MAAVNDMADGCFANRLRRAARAISRHYDAALRPVGLKVSQLSVLVAAQTGAGRLTIVDLAERLGMDRSTLSRNLDPLERRGLVRLGPEERHRARRVALTEAGAALIEAAYPLWQRAQDDTVALVGDLEHALHRLNPIVSRDD